MARYKFNFWLDCDKDDELLVAEQVNELKRKRSFSSVLRDGIMIVSELRQGKVDLLLKLYPFVADMIRQATPPPAPDNSDIERQIAELKRIIMEQGGITAPPANYPVMKSPTAPPVAAVQAAQAADASTISDNFLAFIQ